MEMMVTGPSRSTRTEFSSVMFGPPRAFLRDSFAPEVMFKQALEPVLGRHCDPLAPRNDELGREIRTRHPPIRLQIAFAGGIHDAFRQRRRRGVAVPAAGAALGVEIIAQW